MGKTAARALRARSGLHPYAELVSDGDFVAQPAAFFRRAAFEAVGGVDESLSWAMDYDLWLKLAARYPVAYLPRRLARYRWTGDNKTARGGFPRLAELEDVDAGTVPEAWPPPSDWRSSR
jgi:hypothetical protein